MKRWAATAAILLGLLGVLAAPAYADVRNRPAGPPEVADDDLVLGELDKDGHGSGTFVAKGDPIPPGLAGHPRRPARAPAPKR